MSVEERLTHIENRIKSIDKWIELSDLHMLEKTQTLSQLIDRVEVVLDRVSSLLDKQHFKTQHD